MNIVVSNVAIGLNPEVDLCRRVEFEFSEKTRC